PILPLVDLLLASLVEPPASAAGESGVVELFSDEPSPAETAALSELMEQLLRDLGERHGAIQTLALQGYSASEISEQLGRPARTVLPRPGADQATRGCHAFEARPRLELVQRRRQA